MKGVPGIVIFIIFSVYFFAGFVVTAQIFNFFWEKQKTVSFENDPYPMDYYILTFTPNGIQIIRLAALEEFKRQNSDYSLLVPEDKRTFF